MTIDSQDEEDHVQSTLNPSDWQVLHCMGNNIRLVIQMNSALQNENIYLRTHRVPRCVYDGGKNNPFC